MDKTDTELIWALQTGDMDVVETKMQTKDVNESLSSGSKPIHHACDYGQTCVLEFLISKGADINAPDKHGFTPLLIATFEEHCNIVKVLLEKGADKDWKGPDGKTASEVTENDDIKAMLK
ncbi:myotrophin [Corythoichthys intestinalis]|uniref:myotrophin n=1 Tax=Corythoichthys intestinalis TaxID=161448 RepID=UPI0025A50F8C|nr:myotrophin [Corythoichthys intestinalis]XP_061809544.1 myotrophin-like [Nerophis lumbriciformis]